jgi:hypothetical protein
LPALSRKFKKRHLTIVGVWIIFTVLAFAYFSTERLVNFDVDNKLLEVDHLQLGRYLETYQSSQENGLANSVIHFSKPNCTCQKFSQDHIQDINKMAEDNQFSVTNVVLEQHDIIPATPSVAILDTFGEVIYFGPYGQGLGCSQTSGFAQTMLNNFVKGFSANIIIREAKGCYCSV